MKAEHCCLISSGQSAASTLILCLLKCVVQSSSQCSDNMGGKISKISRSRIHRRRSLSNETALRRTATNSDPTATLCLDSDDPRTTLSNMSTGSPPVARRRSSIATIEVIRGVSTIDSISDYIPPSILSESRVINSISTSGKPQVAVSPIIKQVCYQVEIGVQTGIEDVEQKLQRRLKKQKPQAETRFETSYPYPISEHSTPRESITDEEDCSSEDEQQIDRTVIPDRAFEMRQQYGLNQTVNNNSYPNSINSVGSRQSSSPQSSMTENEDDDGQSTIENDADLPFTNYPDGVSEEVHSSTAHSTPQTSVNSSVMLHRPTTGDLLPSVSSVYSNSISTQTDSPPIILRHPGVTTLPMAYLSPQSNQSDTDTSWNTANDIRGYSSLDSSRSTNQPTPAVDEVVLQSTTKPVPKPRRNIPATDVNENEATSTIRIDGHGPNYITFQNCEFHVGQNTNN